MSDYSVAGPLLLDGRTSHVVEHYAMGATLVGDEAARVMTCPAGPVLVMNLSTVHNGHRCPVTILFPTPTAELASTLRETLTEVAQACRDLHDDDSPERAAMVEAAARAQEANVAAGFLPGPDGTIVDRRCPGCGARLFGPVAVRGGCLACYPDLGPLEAAQVLEP